MNNKYPIWWDTTITLFNKYHNKQTDEIIWYKTYIDNCFIQSAKTMITGGQITYDTDNIIVRIPQQNNYKDYGEWINIPNVEMNKYFTIHPNDIIVKGKIDDEIDEYTEGIRATDLISKYKEIGVCFTVDNWQDNTGVGRVSPHYFVSGE